MASSRSASPRPWRDKRGLAAVEMAAVAPFLLFILIACVDFGRAISQSSDLTNAVRAGAQYAVMAANAQAQIESTVRSALPSNLSAATITTTCYCGALPAGDAGLPPVAACDSACPAGSARMMTVRATIPFQPYNFAFGQTIATAVGFSQVSGSATIRHQ
jgi:TadE-like protein